MAYWRALKAGGLNPEEIDVLKPLIPNFMATWLGALHITSFENMAGLTL